jgi:hypothetical protein
MKIFRLVPMFVAGILLTALAFAGIENAGSAVEPLTQKNILQRFGFVDEDCDGINDLARDSDNDGIPNCLDPDWVRPQDGKGFQSKHGYMHKNANKQGGGPYNNSYNYLWTNNWANSNGPNPCDPTVPSTNQNRNRRVKGKH